jgi:hypothetical protein
MAKASTGGIIGQSFDPFVQQQIKIRQEILGKNPRSDNDNKWYNTSAPWIRLTSGIDVSDEKLQELDLLFTPFQGSGLAKEFQLFGGNNTTTSVTRPFNRDYWDYYYDHEAGYPEYGKVPTPGILSVDVKSLSRGSLREATVSIICHSLPQFKIIETLYLRLKYSILLEWGHSTYYKNDGGYEGNPRIDLSADFLRGYYTDPTHGDVKLTQGTMQSRIRDLRKESCGNYDAFHGLVKNFTWSVRQDGGYDITLILITTGDVIESIKMNSLPNTSTIPSTVTTSSEDKTYPSTYTNQNKSTINKILYGLRQQVDANRFYFNGYGGRDDKNLCNTENLAWVGALGGGNLNWYYHKDDKYASNANPYGTYYEFQSVSLPYMLPDNYYYVDDQYYIKLGTLLKIIESYLLIYDTDTTVSGMYVTDIDGNRPEIGYGNPPIIKIDYDFENNLCLTTDRQVSIDPRVCVLPINISNTSTSSYIEYKWTGVFDYTFDTFEVANRLRTAKLTVNLGSATTSTVNSLPPFIPNAYNGTSANDILDIDSERGTGNSVIPERGALPHMTQLNTRYLTDFTETGPQTLVDIIRRDLGTEFKYTGRAYMNIVEYRNPNSQFGNAGSTPPPNSWGKIYTDIFDGDHGFRTTNVFIGRAMHIPINIEFISKTLEDNIDSKENKIALYDFLRAILDGVQEATGNINNFEIIYDEVVNSLKIIDNTIIPGGLDFLGITQNAIVPINPNLLRQNYGSFARNVSLKTEFSNAFATMVTVGAQANGNVAGENSTAFSKWNGGLTDRIIPRKLTAATTGPSVETIYYNQVAALQDFNASVDERVVTDAQIEAIKGTLSDILKYELGGYTNSGVEGLENGLGFIPLNMSITMEGLSGPKIYEVYTIDETLLPKNYKDKIQFITKGVSHKIDTSGWFTILESIGGPRNKDLVVSPPPPVKKLGTVPNNNGNNGNNNNGGGGGGNGYWANLLRQALRAAGGGSGARYDQRADITENMYLAGKKVFELIHANFPTFVIESNSGNDVFHNSGRHFAGNAIDLSITNPAAAADAFHWTNPGKPSKNAQITQADIDDLMNKVFYPLTAGNSSFRFLNEYNDPSNGATGPHFHISWGTGYEGSSYQAEANRLAAAGTITAITI